MSWSMTVKRKNVFGWNSLGYGTGFESEWIVVGDKTTFDAVVIGIAKSLRSFEKAVPVVSEDPDTLDENQNWLRILDREREGV